MQNSRFIPKTPPTPHTKNNDDSAISPEEQTPKELPNQEQKTINLIKEQQDLTKITIKEQTDILAQKSGQIFINRTQDNRILNSALLELKKLRRLALSQKLERPLKLKKPLKEKDLKKIKSAKQLKNLLKQKT